MLRPAVGFGDEAPGPDASPACPRRARRSGDAPSANRPTTGSGPRTASGGDTTDDAAGGETKPGTRHRTVTPGPVPDGNPLEPLPPELASQRGYTQDCTEGTGDPDSWELATNRFLPSTIVVNRGDVVTLEIFGIRGRDHSIQVFRAGYEIIIDANGTERVSGTPYDNCFLTDTGEPLSGLPVPGPNGACFFVAKRGEVTRVTLETNRRGRSLIHCHTHGTAMQADLIVLNWRGP